MNFPTKRSVPIRRQGERDDKKVYWCPSQSEIPFFP